MRFFPKIEKKKYLCVILVAIAIFLFFRYWDNIAGFFGSVFQALVPLIVGAIIAYILNILESFYERHYFAKKNPKFAQKTRKAVCIIGAILTILIVAALIIGLIIPQLINCVKLIIEKIPGTVESIAESQKLAEILPASIYAKVQEYAQRILDLDWNVVGSKAWEFIKTGYAAHKGTIGSILSSTASVIVSAIIGIIFSIYFLAYKEKIIRFSNRIVAGYFNTKWMEKVLRFLKNFNHTFHKYIVSECVEAVILGSLCLVVMLIFRLPYATMISALVMLMALIPLVGSTISAVVGTFMILSVSPFKAVLFFALLMLIQIIEGNVIYPKVVGKGVGTPGIIVLGAVTVGGSIFGVVGMLVGVPVATTIWNEVKDGLKKREKKQALQTANAAPEEPVSISTEE